jgi:hypothetical protein
VVRKAVAAFYGDSLISVWSNRVNHFEASLEVWRVYGQSTGHSGGVYGVDVAKGQASITWEYVCCLV